MPGPAVRISTDNTGGYKSPGSTSPVFLTDESTLTYAVDLSNGFIPNAYVFNARNFITGQLTQLSLSPFYDYVTSFSISSNGITAAFETQGSTKAQSSTGSFRQIFTQNLQTGTSTLVAESKSYISYAKPVFSPDGNKLLFSSDQTDLIAGDTNGVADIFVKDLINGSVSRVVSAANGQQSTIGNRTFFTADSQKIVFSTIDNSIVPEDKNGLRDVFVKDLNTNTITLVPNATGYQASAVSLDGYKFLLEDTSTNNFNIYSLDTRSGTLTTISTSNASLAYGSGSIPSYSPDGSKVLFTEKHSEVYSNSTQRVVLVDLATSARQMLADVGGDPAFSLDGTRVAFTSGIALVSNDYNNRSDVYLRDLFTPVFGQQVTDTSGNAGKVYALYQGLLGRAPDSLGYEINTAAANAGFSLRDMAASFLASPEGQARSGAVTDVAFVTQLYRTTLGREPDQAGLTTYVDFLKTGGARADVAVGFSLSTEFLNALQPQFAKGVVVTDAQAAQAARLYYAVFDRAPDAGGLQNWTSYLKTGGSLTDAANAFLNSAESKAAGSADNATYVNSLYVNALDRPAEAAGLQGWVDYLNAGGTRGTVAAAIGDSPEAQVHLVGVIENGFFLSA